MQRRGRFLLVAALAIGLLLGITSSASALTMGMGWPGLGFPQSELLNEVQSSGATVYHVPLEYSGNWIDDDQAVEEAWKRGVTIIPTIGASKRFILSSNPEWTNWGTWARAAVERYGYNGTFWSGKAHPTPIPAWEVWNEPNLAANNPVRTKAECTAEELIFHPPTEEEPVGTCIQPKAYGQLLAYTAAQIQAGSKNRSGHGTEVLMGGIATEVGEGFGNFYTSASKTPGAEWTGVALHPYSFTNGVEQMAAEIAGVHSYIGTKTLWITEIGWPVAGTFPAGEHSTPHLVGEPEQATLLTGAFEWIKAHAGTYNIQNVDWYNSRDFGGSNWDGWCGLLRENGTQRPSWSAFVAETGGPPALGASPAMVHEGGNWWAFYRGSDGALHQESLVGTEWIDYKIGGQVAPGTTPSVVHEGSGWWVFYQGADGTLHQESLVKGEWIDYKIGSSMAWSTSPTVVHEGSGWWVFYQAADGTLHQESLVGGEWLDYKIGSSMAWSTSPTVVHEGSGWWVFYQGADGTLHQESLVKGEWLDYKIGASMAAATNPFVVHEGSGWWVFYQGADGKLHQESLIGSEWLDYAIGAQMAPRTTPVVIHEGSGWWVFYQGMDGALHQESATSGIWSDYRIGGSIAWSASPVVVHEASPWGFWAFYQGDDRALWEQSLSGGTWSGYRIGGEF